jgi:hypothetical protein
MSAETGEVSDKALSYYYAPVLIYFMGVLRRLEQITLQATHFPLFLWTERSA